MHTHIAHSERNSIERQWLEHLSILTRVFNNIFAAAAAVDLSLQWAASTLYYRALCDAISVIFFAPVVANETLSC